MGRGVVVECLAEEVSPAEEAILAAATADMPGVGIPDIADEGAMATAHAVMAATEATEATVPIIAEASMAVMDTGVATPMHRAITDGPATITTMPIMAIRITPPPITTSPRQ